MTLYSSTANRREYCLRKWRGTWSWHLCRAIVFIGALTVVAVCARKALPTTISLLAAVGIAEALDAGWRVRVRCAWGPRDGMKRVRECVCGAEFDLETLV